VKQKDLVKAVMESRANSFLEKADTRTKALLLGQRQPHANLWKTAAHTAELFMPPELFQIAALFSIGAPQMEQVLCPCCTRVFMDPFGDHALICMKRGNVVHRHNDAYAVFVTEARRAFISTKVEKTLQLSPDDSYKADIFLTNGIPGLSTRGTALDFTITTNFNKTMVKRSAKTELAAAVSGEERKDNELKDLLEKAGYDFIPLAFEATGGHSPTVLPVAHYFISQRALMTNTPFTELAVNFWQRLSVTIQKANAHGILERNKRTTPVPTSH